ncbi:MAG TPA: hypothetical protein PLY34_17890, partial [Ferruginibacter sp.]|nr:hypothetical protein [Ferruginibacter sp.]
WQVASTMGIHFFEVQWSGNGQDFTTINRVFVDGENKQYQLLHTAAAAINYYRIVSNEYNGERSISKVVRLTNTNVGQGQVVVINPNPVKAGNPVIKLNLLDAESGEMLLHLYTDTGVLVYQFSRVLQLENTVAIAVNKSLPAGVYMVWVSLPGGYKKAHKVLLVP